MSVLLTFPSCNVGEAKENNNTVYIRTHKYGRKKCIPATPVCPSFFLFVAENNMVLDKLLSSFGAIGNNPDVLDITCTHLSFNCCPAKGEESKGG